MADPLFTTVDYVVTAFTHVEPMACPDPAPVFGPRIERGCDESGFYTLRLTHLVWTTTPLPNGHCHIRATEIQERYISNEACRMYKPPTDLAEGDEWLSYIEPPPVSYEWPPPDNPRQWIDLGPCQDTTKPVYRVACVGGRLHVTRWLRITMCMPLPDGRCRKLEVLSQPETYKTEKPCEMEDWADAPAGFTGDEDPELLWKQGAALARPPEEASAPGTLRLGREADRSTSFQPAVRHLHKQELDHGIKPSPGSARWLVLRSLDGRPATAGTLATVTRGKPVTAVLGFEGSDFATKLPLTFLALGSHVEG